MIRSTLVQPVRWRILSGALVVCASSAFGSSLEARLEGRLRGAWVVVQTEVYSNCSSAYTDNEVGAAGVASSGARRFDPGEAAKIEKLNLKRRRVDLYVTLAEPVLMPRIDGPFELFDERVCRAQIKLPVSRDLVKSKDEASILSVVGGAVAVHATRESAVAASNGRTRRAYPEDYEMTLERHAEWQREQFEAEVAARSVEAFERSVRLAREIRDDPDYLAGFAAGAHAMRSWRETSCDVLVRADFDWRQHGVPDDREGDTPSARAWRQGWHDGQELVFSLAVVDGLRGCAPSGMASGQ